MGPSGRIACHLQNSPTTIFSKLACKWPPLKPCTVVNVITLSTGWRLEKAKCLDMISLKKLKNKFNSSATGWPNLDIRAMLIPSEGFNVGDFVSL
jgi:hypothetical protein